MDHGRRKPTNLDAVSVCALVPYPVDTTPSQRYRIEQWLPILAAEGISVDLIPFADSALLKILHKPGRWATKAAGIGLAFLRRAAQVAKAGRYDVILIHRAACIAGPAILERALALHRRPVVFDFDDAIFLLHTTEENKRFGWLKFPGKTAALCRLSNQVIVGNAFLADYAYQHNSQVTIIPSSVDTDYYHPAKRKAHNNRIVVGWTGSSTSQTHLEAFAPMLKKLCEQNDIELRVHSDRVPVLPGVPFLWRPWSPTTEAEEIAQFDIGIMPMPDDPWSRGKCAMKALLYMAVEAATVCSAVGTNREVIRHGENGFLATTEEEFVARVEDLIKDPELRERLGKAGRRTVEDSYSMRHCAARFAQVIRQAVSAENSGAVAHRTGVSELNRRSEIKGKTV